MRVCAVWRTPRSGTWGKTTYHSESIAAWDPGPNPEESGETDPPEEGLASLGRRAVGLDHPENLLILFDTRPIARSFEYRLRGWARTLYCYCDTARRLPQIVQRVREEDDSVDESEIGRKLNEWIDACIMVCIDGAYLSLALVLDRSCRISHASR
jgi:hypothetical protein